MKAGKQILVLLSLPALALAIFYGGMFLSGKSYERDLKSINAAGFRTTGFMVKRAYKHKQHGALVRYGYKGKLYYEFETTSDSFYQPGDYFELVLDSTDPEEFYVDWLRPTFAPDTEDVFADTATIIEISSNWLFREVCFRYEIDGQNYRRWQHALLEDTIKPGQRFLVQYDPGNPASGILLRDEPVR